MASAALWAGCSKKGSTAAADSTNDPAASGPVNPQISGTLATVKTDIDAAQYDAAVQKLLTARATVKSEADRKAFEDQMFEANQALLQKAQSDPKARESYQALGRIITGR